MADLVTSESRRYLHGIQKETNDTTELPYTVPVDNQVTYIDSFTNYGLDTVYGKEYVIAASSGRADASGITNTPAAPITSANVQGALNEVASLANSASSAASSAQSTANSAASAASYADRIARQSDNLIKNGNSEDPDPTGWEAACVYDTTYDSYKAFTGSKVRRTVTSADGYAATFTGEIPCAPGDQHVIEAMVRNINAVGAVGTGILYWGPSGATGWGVQDAKGTTNAWTRADCRGTAPAGTTSVRFYIEHIGAGGAGALAYYDCLYAARKVSVGMIEATGTRDATTYLRGDGVWAPVTAGLTATRTFYAASSSGGATNVLNTVTIKDGIITSWTQA